MELSSNIRHFSIYSAVASEEKLQQYGNFAAVFGQIYGFVIKNII